MSPARIVTVFFVAVMATSSCGGKSPENVPLTPSVEVRAFANVHWSPERYLSWRNLPRTARFESITRALPCSSFVAISGDVETNIRTCDTRETQEYYEVIGYYTQFVAGWDDISDSKGNMIKATEIDSSGAILSLNRNRYETMREELK